ncbi:unnamed protein product [Blepharisma stoltei]|uniref:3-hydroxyisobutyryl-CoA hydrolase n=1 Tax=Blepharisma stoltei TaxID=1481888 RepID=A0AAU9JXC2_9CILI|nr:unnamed protein product [Blepharisma stoltei]
MRKSSSRIESPLVSVAKGNTYFVKINRPYALNSWNLEMIHLLHRLISQAREENKNFVFYGQGRAFSAGGDIISISSGKISSEEIFIGELAAVYYVSLLPTMRIALMDGITMGGGSGLAWSCNIRVSTPNTIWAMPETSIGFSPDAGASYHLSRMNYPELGLYLMLTGDRLNGTDCYLYGFSQYYIEEDIQKVLQEMQDTESFIDVLKKYHVEPDLKQSRIIPVLKELRYCFNIYVGIETIMYRLRELGSKWSLRALSKIQELCPLSLRVAHEAFNRGKHLNYRDCLKMEYNLAVQMTHFRAENFKEAVKHKLVKKESGRVNWIPNSLEEVGNDAMMPLFENEEGPKLPLPRL